MKRDFQLTGNGLEGNRGSPNTVAIDPNDIRLVLRIDCLARGWLGSGERAPGENRHAVSLPTMIVGFARYSRDRSFAVLAQNRSLVLVMAAGSIADGFIGGQLLALVPSLVLLPLLSAYNAWNISERHRHYLKNVCRSD